MLVIIVGMVMGNLILKIDCKLVMFMFLVIFW